MRKHLLTSSIFVIFLFACSGGENPQPSTTSYRITPTSIPPTPTVIQPIQPTGRTVLTFDQLTDNFNPGSPVDDGAFAKPADAKIAKHIFEGRLELIGEETNGDIQVLRGNQYVEPEVPHLPEFNYEFVQSGDYFIPVQRGLIITDHPIWNYILEPGRVWQEEGDESYSRVS